MLQDLIAGFDQEAAAAIMARLVSFKMENEVIIFLLASFKILNAGPVVFVF